MKHIKTTSILFSFIVALGLSACNTDKKEKEAKDSVQAAATADSLLNAALADTISSDSVKIDTIK